MQIHKTFCTTQTQSPALPVCLLTHRQCSYRGHVIVRGLQLPLLVRGEAPQRPGGGVAAGSRRRRLGDRAGRGPLNYRASSYQASFFEKSRAVLGALVRLVSE